uniref:Uncharacterized protein n=1 Tax=Panagrolaimus sp. ES5 TaxID=591445 RepID=A0AC34FAZ6_9BILA
MAYLKVFIILIICFSMASSFKYNKIKRISDTEYRRIPIGEEGDSKITSPGDKDGRHEAAYGTAPLMIDRPQNGVAASIAKTDSKAEAKADTKNLMNADTQNEVRQNNSFHFYQQPQTIATVLTVCSMAGVILLLLITCICCICTRQQRQSASYQFPADK